MGKFTARCVPMNKYGNVFVKNIFYMLSYAFTALSQENFKDIAKEEFDNIHNLFACILAKGIGLQLKQGLYREYLELNEDLTVMRGKIDMPVTVRNKVARRQVLACEYDELSENNRLNQILKTTVMILLRHAHVETTYKNELKKEMLFFSHVDTIDPVSIRWAALRFHRNNNTYQMLIGLCQFILEGMLMSTDGGTYRLASFMDEQKMFHLYEKFILEYYRKEYPRLKASASQIPWALDDGVETMLPIMQSDITLSYKDKILIIDAKFWTHSTQTQYNRHTVHSGNLYQIFTYVKNKTVSTGDKPCEVAGMLLYAQTDEMIQQDAEYRMSGNKIRGKTLALSCDFKINATKLNEIIEN